MKLASFTVLKGTRVLSVQEGVGHLLPRLQPLWPTPRPGPAPADPQTPPPPLRPGQEATTKYAGPVVSIVACGGFIS